METNELFEKIVKLEADSEELTISSLRDADEIKKKAKIDLETLKDKLLQEKKQLSLKLEQIKETEESALVNTYKGDFALFSNQLTEKSNTGLGKIVNLFKEQNKI